MKPSRDLLSDVVTLARLIRTEADKRARAHGMTRAQWSLLLKLERQPGLLQKELAEILEVEPITVARLVDRLEARSMVERRSDPFDRRCWRLHLTEASRPLLSDIDRQLTDLAKIACTGIDEASLQTLTQAIASMRDTLTSKDTATKDAPPRATAQPQPLQPTRPIPALQDS